MNFLLAFIPIFVAVDPLGLLPIFVGLTQDLTPAERRKIVVQSILTALSLAAGFIVLGKIIFRLLGITVGDFMIAGGAILFCLAIIDIIQSSDQRRRLPFEDLGVVPLGTPLMVGPAVLTTSLIIIDEFGIWMTLLSVLVNVLIVAAVFSFADQLVRVIGKSGARALSKVVALLLAAIAVMMIRRGIFTILAL